MAVVVLDSRVGGVGRLRDDLLERDLSFHCDGERLVKHVPQQRLGAWRDGLHARVQVVNPKQKPATYSEAYSVQKQRQSIV